MIKVIDNVRFNLRDDLIREKFDYTKWQREYFDRIPANQLHEDVVTYAANHPYTGKAKEIIK